jgi:hypothetical protein
MNDDKTTNAAPLPLVVQLGFAGSRELLDESQHAGIDVASFEAEVETWLAARIRQLRTDLALEDHHFFCGVSALAIGGDMVFCKACQANGVPVRIFLPQTRDEFLNAVGSNGPDFSLESQKDEALRLLNGSNVIQEWLVSNAPNRGERFEDTNREIVRVSDVLISLVREDAKAEAGGTEDLIGRAAQRGKPVLVVKLGLAKGKPQFREEWQLPSGKDCKPPKNLSEFVFPKAPKTLIGVQLPTADTGKCTPIERYVGQVKQASSDTAKAMRRKFRRMAIIIIGAHILSTILATVGLAFAHFHLHTLPALLSLELVMLACGFTVHEYLHRSRTSHLWAEARLLAEVSRSVLAVGNLHVYLEHLFWLPLPAAIRPVLRTINVLQLQSTRQDRSDWTKKRDRYVDRRLVKEPKGQIPYYEGRATNAGALLSRLHRAFKVCWIAAFISTLIKLVLHFYLDEHLVLEDLLGAITGSMAIIMPVLAVAALSFAAALDLAAQQQVYREMVAFLEKQVNHLKGASGERDFARLVIETEYQLLGETANWYSRRSVGAVA